MTGTDTFLPVISFAPVGHRDTRNGKTFSVFAGRIRNSKTFSKKTPQGVDELGSRCIMPTLTENVAGGERERQLH
jgi:hypothetical protein